MTNNIEISEKAIKLAELNSLVEFHKENLEHIRVYDSNEYAIKLIKEIQKRIKKLKEKMNKIYAEIVAEAPF